MAVLGDTVIPLFGGVTRTIMTPYDVIHQPIVAVVSVTNLAFANIHISLGLDSSN